MLPSPWACSAKASSHLANAIFNLSFFQMKHAALQRKCCRCMWMAWHNWTLSSINVSLAQVTAISRITSWNIATPKPWSHLSLFLTQHAPQKRFQAFLLTSQATVRLLRQLLGLKLPMLSWLATNLELAGKKAGQSSSAKPFCLACVPAILEIVWLKYYSI